MTRLWGRGSEGWEDPTVDEFDPKAALEVRAEQALEFAQEQVRALITRYPDFFPLYTEEGQVAART